MEKYTKGSGSASAFDFRDDENHKNLSQGSRSPGRYLKPSPLEYEAGVLTSSFTTFDDISVVMHCHCRDIFLTRLSNKE
jgi:hypothetical protein